MIQHTRYPGGGISGKDCVVNCPACAWEQMSKEPVFRTYTGKLLNPLALKVEDVCIEDIAHHLACINRWCGALREPISVAQHSVLVALLCEHTPFALEGLLHDRAEAYLGDVTKWVKKSPIMEGYRIAEAHVEQVTAAALGIQEGMPPEVEWADRLMITFEGRTHLKNYQDLPGFPTEDPQQVLTPERMSSWPWQMAETVFLDFYRRLEERR